MKENNFRIASLLVEEWLEVIFVTYENTPDYFKRRLPDNVKKYIREASNYLNGRSEGKHQGDIEDIVLPRN